MAAVINDRDVLLQAASVRLLNTVLSDTVSVAGDVVGTLNGVPVQDVIDAANTTGSGTDNFFTQSTSNPTGGGDGDAHWNSATQTMWFKINGSWTIGGTVNANQITAGTLAAARIAVNSITSDKISVTNLSALTANLGNVNAGNITGSANIDITGSARFKGATSEGGVTYAGAFNTTLGSSSGLYAQGNSEGVRGVSTSGSVGIRGLSSGGGGGSGVYGSSSDGIGVKAQSNFNFALDVVGSMRISSSALVNNLYAARAVTVDNFNGSVPGANVTGTVSNAAVATFATNSGSTDFVSGGNVSGAVATANNSNSLGGFQASSWVRIIATNSGNTNASGAGFQLHSTVSGVRTRAAGGNLVVIESFSDGRYKENVVDETYGLSFINALRPVQYEVKESARQVSDLSSESAEKITLPSYLYHGFLSGEVKDLVSDANDCIYQTHSDGVEGVDYMSLIAPLVKAVQELSEEVNTLKGMING